MSQETIKSLLDKINLLFNVFLKDGLEQISELEKDLLKEQIQNLLGEVERLQTKTPSLVKEMPPVAVTETPEDEKKEVPTSNTTILKELVADEKEVSPEVSFMDKFVDTPITTNTEEVPPTDVEEERTFNDSKPTRSLKQVIDLNKSFIFKAELFENKQEEYAQFIDILNAFQTEKESILFVEDTAVKRSWDKENHVYELLLRAVEKRFLPLLQQ